MPSNTGLNRKAWLKRIVAIHNRAVRFISLNERAVPQQAVNGIPLLPPPLEHIRGLAGEGPDLHPGDGHPGFLEAEPEQHGPGQRSTVDEGGQ